MTGVPGARPRLGPIRPTALDLALALFLVTAGIGVCTAQDRSGAWSRFWLIAAGIILCGVIARAPVANLGAVAIMAGGLTAVLSVYFLLTNDWSTAATDFAWLQAAGKAWTAIRPDLHLPTLLPNQAGGLLAFLFPLSVASTISAWRRKADLRWVLVVFSAITALGVTASSSRGAWGALAVSGVVVASCWLWRRTAFRSWRLKAVALLALLAIVGLCWAAATRSGGRNRDPQAAAAATPAGENRWELARDTLDLIGDFPLTGAGLGSFPGLYSRYILAVPQFYLGYAHNLYLDIALAQGPLALAVLVFVLAGSLLASAIDVTGEASVSEGRLLQAATLAGIVVLAVHGLVDDPVYEGMGVTVLFLYPGMAASLRRGGRRSMPSSPKWITGLVQNGRRWLAGAALLLLGALALTLAQPATRSAWYANLGALGMARQELAGWPDDGLLATEASIATEGPLRQFERALELDPTNRTAQQRLGMLRISRGEWESGISALESALRSDPSHRGIRKLLGYAYTWNGDLPAAQDLLASIPEAESEMEFYAWWWGARGRSAQAQRAQAMLGLLGG